MSEPKVVVGRHESGDGTVRSYSAGFGLSLVLTLVAYLLVTRSIFAGWTLAAVLGVLAITQLLVQLFFFLHLGREARPRWNLVVMLFAVMVVGTIVFGSLWIMRNIQYHHTHMSPGQTDQFITHDEGYQQ